MPDYLLPDEVTDRPVLEDAGDQRVRLPAEDDAAQVEDEQPLLLAAVDAEGQPGDFYQFERTGSFCHDIVDSKPGRPVLNRIVTLRDSWAKIEKQQREVERFEEYEKKAIPTDFDYSRVQSLSTEAREKLSRIQPASIGQASRIPGVSASDVSILAVYLR